MFWEFLAIHIIYLLLYLNIFFMRMSLPQERTHSSRGLTYSGAVAGGPGGAMAPPIVETRRKIVNVVGNCQSCRREGGGGG
jgi:hypothetical protein